MALYLVQHGKAFSKEEDPDRRLNETGKHDTRLIAEKAKEFGAEVKKIEHSGKTRAQETADIFAEVLDPSGGVHQKDGIKATDDVTAVELDQAEGTMLVGHLPFMEKIAAYLTAGDQEKTVIKFQNSGIVCLDRDDDGWHIKWALNPDMT